MQVERVIRPIGRPRRVGAVLSGGAHVVGTSEARVDGGFATCAGIGGVFGEALACVVLFVCEACGGDGRAWCGGCGVGAGGGTEEGGGGGSGG